MLYVAGFVLILLGGALHWWRPHQGGGGTVTIKLGPLGSVTLSTSHAGTLCIVLGVVLLIVAEFRTGGGEEQRPSRAVLELSTVVLAQERADPAVQVSAAGEHDGAVWTYLGPESAPDEWAYRTIMLAPDGTQILQARRPMPLRKHHYGRLTGTLLGRVLGYERPELVGHAEQGDCIHVLDRTVVGFGKVWLNARPVSCTPAQQAIQRAVTSYRQAGGIRPLR